MVTKVPLALCLIAAVSALNAIIIDTAYDPHNVRYINDGIVIVPFREAVSDEHFFDGGTYPLLRPSVDLCEQPFDGKRFILVKPNASITSLVKWLHCAGSNKNLTLIFPSVLKDKYLVEAKDKYKANIMFVRSTNAAQLYSYIRKDNTLATVNTKGDLLIENLMIPGHPLFRGKETAAIFLCLLMLTHFIVLNGRCNFRQNLGSLFCRPCRKISKISMNRSNPSEPKKDQPKPTQDISIEMEVQEAAS